MSTSLFTTCINGQSIPIDAIPVLSISAFRDSVCSRIASGASLSALFGQMTPRSDSVRLIAVTTNADSGQIAIASTTVDDRYSALTPECPQAHWFEREIAEQWGIVPEGHPWLKPIRFHRGYRAGNDAWGRSGADDILPAVQPAGTEYFKMNGDEIHEVSVGPVHAGVIEPGHFRFQCHGEHVFSMEVALGFQHRGVERNLIGGPNKKTLHYMETLAGDTSIGHGFAYCQTVEALAGGEAPLRAQFIRAIALELERLANHTGDLGALAGDVGYLPTMSYCGRLRGDILNVSALLCGNRFGRGVLQVGGVRFDMDDSLRQDVSVQIERVLEEVKNASELLWSAPSVLARLEDVGVVTKEQARDLGVVGPVARSSGMGCDIRHDFPTGAYRFAQIPVSIAHTGDCFARAYMRWLEIQRSGVFILEQLKGLPNGAIRCEIEAPRPDSMVVSLVEGWRGEICHVATTDDRGKIAHYKIVDPSFHNWMGLAIALRGQQISDFPLCNKSFNLSYCGHDL